MKVIFLDMDGVLNSDAYFDSIRGKNIEGIEDDVDVKTVKMLKKCVDEIGAKVVVTASARYARTGNMLMELLAQNGILADRTPLMKNERGTEIKNYLSTHPDVEDFVILDDEIYDSYDEFLLSKLVKISDQNGRNFGEGLQEKDILEVKRRLGKPKSKNVDYER